MESVASALKSEREKQKISLAQIAADTRISLRHLESLEEGRYSDLPGGMYNRAFLRAYCESLHLDQREIIQRYEAEISPLSEKLPRTKVHIPPQRSSRRLGPIAIWSLMLLVSAAGIFFSRKWIAGIFSPYFSRAPEASVRFEPPAPQPAAPARAPTPVTASPAQTSVPPASTTSEPSAPSPALQETPPVTPVQASLVPAGGELSSHSPASLSPLRLEISATEECWISLENDGNRTPGRLLKPGEIQSFNAEQSFFIRIGNAGGIHLKINGKPAKPLGKSGEVKTLLINEKNLPELIDQTTG